MRSCARRWIWRSQKTTLARAIAGAGRQAVKTKALGYCSPREFRKQFVEETTENAVGAVRRPHESPLCADAVGSRPRPPAAVARSASLDAGAAVDQP